MYVWHVLKLLLMQVLDEVNEEGERAKRMKVESLVRRMFYIIPKLA